MQMADVGLLHIGLRLLAAAGMGALIGLDRELSDQPAGLRTHILVAVGAALFTMSGSLAFSAPVDPTRVAAQVVTGIGFLGAGAILRQGTNVRGLTTAAGLWVTAAVGVAVAFGFWEGAGFATGISVLALFGLKRFERAYLRKLKPGRFEFIVQSASSLRLSAITEFVEANRGKLEQVEDVIDGESRVVTMVMRMPPKATPSEIAEALRKIEGVNDVDWRR